MARRIIRSSSYTPSTRTVVRRKDGKLTANQKWLNSLGKTGMFDWEVSIKQDGIVRTKTMKFDTIDDARAWSYNRCQPGQTYFIDGMEVVSR
jgi:hypothetical protein